MLMKTRNFYCFFNFTEIFQNRDELPLNSFVYNVGGGGRNYLFDSASCYKFQNFSFG